MRLCIFILSYNAERHIVQVLSRIPSLYLNSPDTEILMIDDASPDRTVELARAHVARQGWTNVKVLRNRQNQGYGGNQKVGYRYAILKGFDVVAMLHGDGQYAPEVLPRLLEPFAEDPAPDAVLGVRFGKEHSPIQGGMPLYKYAGNRILTLIQNRLAQASLSEWHTGYRAYRTRALARIAFELNANDFHFDTEILLQLLDRRSRLREVNIPTHYGDEICHVNGLPYAKNVLKATLKYRLQKYNLFYDVRYHPEILQQANQDSGVHPLYQEKRDAFTPHSLVIRDSALVPPNSRVLDIGCSTGYVARALAGQKGCAVTGVDILPPSEVPEGSFTYHALDLEKGRGRLNDVIDQGNFDVILMLDVLEHLSTPELFLLNLYKRPFQKPPSFIVSTGNIAFVVVRIMLLLGFFNYGNRGILDVTHKRLFSLRTFRNLLEQTGFVIRRRILFPFPFRALGFPPRWAAALERVNRALLRWFPALFAYQVLFVATPLQPPQTILEETLANPAEPQEAANPR